MRFSKLVTAIFLVLCVSGCATTVKYSFDNSLYRRNAPLNYCVLVDNFEDGRPAIERDGTVYKGKDVSCTADKNFKPNVNTQISQMLVEHLNKAQLFNAVQFKDVDDNLYQAPDEMDKLSKQGIDLVITGNINHFYGYMSNPAAVAYLFGLAGAFAEMAANPKTVGADVEYGNIKIIDVKNKKVLWEGDVKYNFEDKVTFYDSPVAYALRGLKSVNEKLVLTLESKLKQ